MKPIPVRLMRPTPDCVNGIVDLVDWVHPRVRGNAVDVGTYAGETAAILSETGMFEVIYCVDSYRSPGDGLAERYFRVRQHSRPNMWQVRMSSTRAALALPDETFDLIYLNDVTDERQLTRDIRAWLPKLRPHGVIAGRGWHTMPRTTLDYLHPTDVTDIVHAAVTSVLGEPHEVFVDGSWACRP